MIAITISRSRLLQLTLIMSFSEESTSPHFIDVIRYFKVMIYRQQQKLPSEYMPTNFKTPPNIGPQNWVHESL